MKKAIISLVVLAAFSAQAYAAPKHTEKYVKTLVSQELRDPESARFHNVKVLSSKKSCGFVKGKNMYGGYTDNTYFYVYEDQVHFLENEIMEMVGRIEAQRPDLIRLIKAQPEGSEKQLELKAMLDRNFELQSSTLKILTTSLEECSKGVSK